MRLWLLIVLLCFVGPSSVEAQTFQMSPQLSQLRSGTLHRRESLPFRASGPSRSHGRTIATLAERLNEFATDRRIQAEIDDVVASQPEEGHVFRIDTCRRQLGLRQPNVVSDWQVNRVGSNFSDIQSGESRLMKGIDCRWPNRLNTEYRAVSPRALEQHAVTKTDSVLLMEDYLSRLPNACPVQNFEERHAPVQITPDFQRPFANAYEQSSAKGGAEIGSGQGGIPE